jgi:hypothetical protein
LSIVIEPEKGTAGFVFCSMSLIHFNSGAFFHFLKEDLGPEVNVADWLAKTLDIGTSSAYKRIRGQAALTVDELLTIIEQSPRTAQMAAELFKAKPLKVIQLNQFTSSESFERYLTEVEGVFMKAAEFEDFEFSYSARDLPIFFFFSHPLMIRHKLSVWTGLGRGEKLPRITERSLQRAQRIWDMYRSIPSVELWKPDAFKRQKEMLDIEYELGSLCATEHDELENCLHGLLVETIKNITDRGHKRKGGDLTLYSTSAFTLNNGGRLRFGGRDILFGAVHNAQHFNTTSSEIIQLYDLVWKRHLDGALSVLPGTPMAQDSFIEQIQF